MYPAESRSDGVGHLVDRLAIEEVLIRYCTAIDNHDWELMDSVFEPSGLWDSISVGGVAGPYCEIRAWQEAELRPFEMTHHLSNITVAIDGDAARSTSYVSAPIIPVGPEVPGATFVVGASYHDRLVRTAAGWRIAERIERGRWMLGSPPS